MADSWIDFQYAGFYDRPLMLAFEFEDGVVLLSRDFNATKDEYESEYQVFRLSKPDFENHRNPWSNLLNFTQLRLGVVPVDVVEFDASRRKSLLLESITKHVPLRVPA